MEKYLNPSLRMSKKTSPFDVLPPELILYIVSFTDFEDDYLSLITTCKAARAFLPRTLQQVMKDGYGTDVRQKKVRRGGFGWGWYGGHDKVVSETPHALTALAYCHIRFEMKITKTGLPKLVICTQCGKIRDKDCFADLQLHRILHLTSYNSSAGWWYERICNPCAVESDTHYYASRYV